MNDMGLATISVPFPEHYSEASAIASILPALVKEKLSETCLSWFTQDAIDRCQEICFDAENNTFTTPDDLMMDFLLDKQMRDTEPVVLEGLPTAPAPTSRRRRPDDSSFHSFGTEFSKTNNNPPTPPPTTGH
jgi:hypothetical protein